MGFVGAILRKRFFRKRNLLPHDFQKGLADLIIYLILPCNILHSFFTDQGKHILSRGREIWIVALLTQIACYIFARTALSGIPKERRSVMQYGTICSNAGFIGTPIVQGLYGAEGLLLSAVYLIPPRVVFGIVFFSESEAEEEGKKLEKGASTSMYDRCVSGNDCHDEEHTFVSLYGKEYCSPRILQYRHVHVFNWNDFI